MASKAPVFLTLAEVVEIHSDQIERYGGTKGIRDIHLLQPALAQPEASFGGEWLHEDLFELAAPTPFTFLKPTPFLTATSGRLWQAHLSFFR